MSQVVLVLTVFYVVVTFIPLTHITHWLVRVFDFPRLQLSVLGLSLFILQLVYPSGSEDLFYLFLLLTLLATSLQVWRILPYTVFWPTEVKQSGARTDQNRLTILNANVLMTNRNATTLIEQIEQLTPDIIVTLESDLWWQKALSCISKKYPYSICCPLDNLYGMHVFSKLPLKEHKIDYLVEENVPSIHTLISLRNGVDIRAHFLHPAPPSPTENTYSSERDAELLVVAKSISDNKQPTIVLGDLNDVAWSSTTRLFRQKSGLLDPRIGRGMFNTFHASYWFARWPLDHLFHSEHFRLNAIKRLSSIGSDHFPLLTTLTFEPTKQNNSDVKQKEDLSRVEQIIDKEGVSQQDVPEP